MIPSLSIWSCVKFPFPKYGRDDKITKPYSVESCDGFIKRHYEKSKEERRSETINLRVPCSLNLEKENSVPNLYCECTRDKQNFHKCKKKNRHIRFVTAPEIIFYDKDCAISTTNLSHFQSANVQSGKLHKIFRDKDEETELERIEEKLHEIGSIPSVKAWTSEELVEIKRQKEEAKKKVEARKSSRQRKNGRVRFKN